MARPSKVLIVEDEQLIAESLIDLLKPLPEYDVIGTAVTAEQAFAYAERDRPDIAIVDVHLSSALDGVTLAIELSHRYDTTTIFITGNPQTVFNRAWEFRHSVLAKPFTDAEFLDAVGAVRQKRTHD
jgi:DNA-binding NarL/FixJ family response regulator